MFEQGIPIFSGEPELFDEYLDRVETLVHQYTEEVIKKQGPLAPRLYNALKGEAYMAAKAVSERHGPSIRQDTPLDIAIPR